MDVLICNNIKLDLSGSTPFPLDLSIMDLLEPQKRQRNKSKQVVFSGTANNQAFFYSAFDLNIEDNVTSFDSTVKASCQYYKNDVLLMPDGILRLIDVTINNGVPSFTTEIYGESVDIFLLLSEINVADLDWSEYDHTLSRANIISSWSTPSGSGYRYPLIERGNGRAGTTIWNTTDLVPYVHQREVIYKMFEYLGIEISSTFLETTRAKNLLFGYGGGDYISQSLSPADTLARRVVITDGDFTYSQSTHGNEQQDPFWVGTDYTIRYDYPFKNISTPLLTSTEDEDSLDQYVDGVITVARSGNYQLDIAGVLEIDLVGGNTFQSFSDVSIRMFKNGQNIYTLQNQNLFMTQTGATTWDFDFNISNSFYFQSGDVITFSIDTGYAIYTRPDGVAQTPLTLNITTTTPIAISMLSLDSSVTDGSDVLLSRFIPEIKCSEFLIGFMRQFYITTTDPDINGVIEFEPLVDFYQQTNKFDDISKKIDHLKPIVVKPSANEYQKNHVFMYKNNKDTDNVNYFEQYANNYGDYTFIQGSFYSKGDNKIELPWSNIVPYEISTGIIVPRFVIIDNNGGVKGNKGNPRVMMWNGLKNGSWTFRNTDDPTDFQVLTTYPCVHHFDNWENPTFDLNFQLIERVYYPASLVTTINCFSEYYSIITNEMTSPNGRIVDVYVKWNENDVKNRDFSLFIMIDGALFRLNKISDFDNDKSTSVKIQLLKVLKANKRSTKPIVNDTIPIQDGLVGLTSGGFGIDTTDDDAPVIGSGIVGSVNVNSKLRFG